MALTLGKLRDHARENSAPDPSGSTADREVNGWINRAFQRIWRHSWRRNLRYAQLLIPAAESGTSTLTATQVSQSISLSSGIFENKYIDESWALKIDGQGGLLYSLATITNPTAAVMNEYWTGSTSSTLSYFFAKDKFDIPDGGVQLMRVADALSHYELGYLEPHEFDFMRQTTPGTQSPNPAYYTTRQDKLWIWPLPGSSPRVLELSMRIGPPRYETTDDDTTVVDWPEKWADLLQRAIDLEAAISQGKNSPADYRLVKYEFDETFDNYKAEDGGISDLTGPLNPILPGQHYPYWQDGSYPNSSSVPEIGNS